MRSRTSANSACAVAAGPSAPAVTDSAQARTDAASWSNATVGARSSAVGGPSIGAAIMDRTVARVSRVHEPVPETIEERQLALLVSSVRDYAIFMLDPTGHVRSWNTGARHLKGYEPAEIIGRHFST